MLLGSSAQDSSPSSLPYGVLWGDAVHDDTAALNAWFAGLPVSDARTGEPVKSIDDGEFLVLGTLSIPESFAGEIYALFLGPDGREPDIRA